jgi:hypothetical protein
MEIAMSGRLNADQVNRYNKEGFIVVKEQLFAPAKFAALQKHFNEQLAVWEKWNQRSPEHMDVPHFVDTKLFEWLLSDEVLDLVEPLLGPDIALFSSHFICKPPAVGKRVPWHEDSAYWKGRLDPMEVATVWLAVDPSRVENGCMRVVPRSHADGFSAYEKVANPEQTVFDTEIKKGAFDESKAVDLVLDAGECSIHHAKMIHGSNANKGTMRRCGYTMRFMPTTVKVTNRNEADSAFQIYLARGKDRAGNTYGDPSKVNQKWLDRYPDGWPAGH